MFVVVGREPVFVFAGGFADWWLVGGFVAVIAGLGGFVMRLLVCGFCDVDSGFGCVFWCFVVVY